MQNILIVSIIIILIIVVEFAFRIPKHCLKCQTEFSFLKDLLTLGSAAYFAFKTNQQVRIQKAAK